MASAVEVALKEVGQSAFGAYADARRLVCRSNRAMIAMERRLLRLHEEHNALEETTRRLEAELLEASAPDDGSSADPHTPSRSSTAHLLVAKRDLAAAETAMVAAKRQADVLAQDNARLASAATSAREDMEKAENRAKLLALELADVLRWKASAAGQLSEAASTAATAATEAQASSMARETTAVLRKALAEARAIAMQAQKDSRTLEETNERSLAGLRAQLEVSEASREAQMRQLHDLKSAHGSLNAELERVKHDAKSEIGALKEICAVQKHALGATEAKVLEWETTVAEERARDVKDLDEVVGSSRKRRRGLAEDMLLAVKGELESKAGELEKKSAQCEKIIAQEQRVKVTLQTLTRERDNLGSVLKTAEKRAASAEQQLMESHARNADLERRILLMGRPVAASAPPRDHHSLNLVTPDPSRALATVGKQPEPLADDRVRTPLTPAENAIRRKLDELRSSHKRQEELITRVVAQRRLSEGGRE